LNSSNSNSNLSLNFIDDQADIDRLREENELLNIKINKLRYELKSRDQTVEDLKSNITQMYVNLENTQMARKHSQYDIESLKSDIVRLNTEKLNYFEQLKRSIEENEEKNKRLQKAQMTIAELNLTIEKLKSENDQVNKQNMEIKVKALKEKEDLIKNLEKIEKEIIQRERNLFNSQYEKLLIESCEKIRLEDSKSYNMILQNEIEKIKIIYESEIKKLQEKDLANKNLIEELQKAVLEETGKSQPNENKSIIKSEYHDKLLNLNRQIDEFKYTIENLNKELSYEKEKSNERNNELISLNKQKFKLMAQIKQYQKNDNFNKNNENNYDEIYSKYENLLTEFNELKKSEYILIQIQENINQKNQLENLFSESQESNKNLQINLSEWSNTNKNLELMILNEQELNTQLIQNLNEWKESNIQIENSILETQQIGENLKHNILQLKQDSDLIKEECIKVKNIEILNNDDEKIESLKIIKEKLEKDLNDLDTSKLQLECDIIALKNDLEFINDKKDSLEQQLKLKQEIHIEEINRLNNEITSLKDELNKNNNKITNDEQYETLIYELSCKKTQIDELTNKLDQKISNEFEFENRLKQNLEKIEQISTEYDNYKADKNILLESLQNELKINKSQLSEKDHIIDELDSQTKHLNSQILKINESLNKSSQENEILNSKIEQNNIENLNHLKYLEIEINEKNNLQQKLFELKSFNEALNINLIEWISTNTELENLIINEQESNSKLMENLSEWKSTNNQLQLLKDQELSKILKEIEILNNTLITKDNEIIDLKSQLELNHKDNNEKLEKLVTEITQLKDTIKLLEEVQIDNSILKSNLAKFQLTTDEKISTENQLNNLRALNTELVENLNEWTTANKNIESLILNEQEINSNFLANLSDWKESNIQLENEIEKLNIKTNGLNNEIREIQKYNFDLETSFNDLKDKKELITEIDKLKFNQSEYEELMKNKDQEFENIKCILKQKESENLDLNRLINEFNTVKMGANPTENDFQSKFFFFFY